MAGPKLSPSAARAVEELAAIAFWRRAQRDGLQSVCDAVLAGGAEPLMLSTFTADQVELYLAERKVPGSAVDAVKLAIRMLEKSQESGDHLLGPIYPSDVAHCRSKTVTAGLLSQCVSIPRSYTGGGMLPAFGRLVVRPPFPAFIVEAKASPFGLFVVKDTSLALGHSVIMLMQRQRSTPLANGAWLTTGNFLVPAPDSERGARWGALIPNSAHHTNGISAVNGDGAHRIEFGW